VPFSAQCGALQYNIFATRPRKLYSLPAQAHGRGHRPRSNVVSSPRPEKASRTTRRNSPYGLDKLSAVQNVVAIAPTQGLCQGIVTGKTANRERQYECFSNHHSNWHTEFGCGALTRQFSIHSKPFALSFPVGSATAHVDLPRLSVKFVRTTPQFSFRKANTVSAILS
jgi:hypothetical protein